MNGSLDDGSSQAPPPFLLSTRPIDEEAGTQETSSNRPTLENTPHLRDGLSVHHLRTIVKFKLNLLN